MTISTASFYEVLVKHRERFKDHGRVRICGFTLARPVTPQEHLMDVSMAAFR